MTHMASRSSTSSLSLLNSVPKQILYPCGHGTLVNHSVARSSLSFSSVFFIQRLLGQLAQIVHLWESIALEWKNTLIDLWANWERLAYCSAGAQKHRTVPTSSLIRKDSLRMCGCLDRRPRPPHSACAWTTRTVQEAMIWKLTAGAYIQRHERRND